MQFNKVDLIKYQTVISWYQKLLWVREIFVGNWMF